jgi:polyketide synthase PksN
VLSGDKKAQIEALRQMGAKIEYKEADVSQRQAVAALIQGITEAYGNLNGIIHGAGIIRDNFIIKKTAEELQEVLAPKVAGLVNLDEATKDSGLDFFIVFSSGAAPIGNLGQADYATANAFMDAYAGYRTSLVKEKQRHGQTVSINWPLWKEGGMRVNEENEKLMAQSMGLLAMETAIGINALYQSSAANKQQVMVLTGKISQIRGSLLAAINSGVQQTQKSIKQEVADSLQEKVQSVLRETAAELLNVNPEDIDIDADINEQGFDPIIIQKFVNLLGQKYNLELESAMFYEYQTLRGFTKYFLEDYKSLAEKQFGIKTENTARPVNEAVPEIGEEALREKAASYLKKLLSSVIKLPAHKIDVDAQMEKYGIDSIMVIQLTNQLEKTFGSLSKTLFFEYQNIRELTGYFLENYREHPIQN